MIGIMRKKRYTQQEIEILKSNPNVKDVRENRLTLTYKFRKIIYEAWIKDPRNKTIRNVLSQNSFDLKMVGSAFISNIHTNFTRRGSPKGGKNKIIGKSNSTFRTDKQYNQFLLSTGKFKKGDYGIGFSDLFINEIYHEYPTVSIEEQLIKYGIDPEKVGYQRIYHLKRRLDNNKITSVRIVYDENFINKYSSHPYVSKCTKKQFVLSNQFYNEASRYSQLHIDEILGIFEFDSKELDITLKTRIKYKLDYWKKTDKKVIDTTSETYLKIQRNKIDALIKMIHDNFNKVREIVPLLSCQQKRQLCLWIRSIPHNRYDFTMRKILSELGLSKSQYYHILKSHDYGCAEQNKSNQDDVDIKIIESVLNSEKYPMGHRMVYMRMKNISGVQFGKNKILRLMRKYNLSSNVREKKQSRIEAKKQLEERKKPNLLKRQFRLHKPYEVLLTDVSYIKYGSGKTAYLSAIKDSVTGRVYTMDISDSNDLLLVESSIGNLSNYKFHNGLFHSDQGALYLNNFYQTKIENLGFTQSMSKRGNCWDNAPQESFFGHFKDECKELITQCSTLEELKVVINDYMDYYNNRRPQWCRNKMTPIEYEEYLLSMNDDEFHQYLDKEQKKYDNMMEKAKEKAIIRATDIGAGG